MTKIPAQAFKYRTLPNFSPHTRNGISQTSPKYSGLGSNFWKYFSCEARRALTRVARWMIFWIDANFLGFLTMGWTQGVVMHLTTCRHTTTTQHLDLELNILHCRFSTTQKQSYNPGLYTIIYKRLLHINKSNMNLLEGSIGKLGRGKSGGQRGWISQYLPRFGGARIQSMWQCKLRKQVANFANNANGATWWPNFEPI